MKIKKWMKVLFVVIGIGFLLLCTVITIKEYLDVRVEEALDNEIRRIEKQMTINNIDKGVTAIDVGEMVSTRKYKLVEEAYENYCIDYFNEAILIHQKFEEIIKNNIESLETIEQDKPDFVYSEDILKKEREQIEQEQKNYKNLTTEKKIMSYFGDDTKIYYKYYYKEKVYNMKNNSFSKALKDELSLSLEIIEERSKLVELLKTKTWKIEEDKILFEEENDQNEYQSIYDNIVKIEKEHK